MQVLELMRSHAIRVAANATLGELVDMFDLYQHVGLPVVDADDRLLGFVTESVVTSLLLAPYRDAVTRGDSAAARALAERLSEMPVAEAMSRDVAAIDEHTDVMDAAGLMLSRGLKRMPVTSGGRLVGTIGRNDISQAILDGDL